MNWNRFVTAVAGLLLGTAAFAQTTAPAVPSSATTNPPAPSFTPPAANTIPDSPFGQAVRKGQDIFMQTTRYAGSYAGNSLNCASCHMDAGRQANASPLWAAYVLYPAYRSKNGHVNTLAERLQGCFRFSMNGKVPAADSDVIVALESYMYWLATGAPTGTKLAGQGFPKLAEPAQAPEYTRGQKVFEQNCAACHGANGQGQHDTNGRMVFPALWGDDSFNWGAGMHSVSTAAAFIHANMPLSQGGKLTEQQAWDVAYFMNAHERPQDPRYNGDLQDTIKKHHGGKYDLYGHEINGVVLGANSTPSGGRFQQDAGSANKK
jgi:thiosulfate dehydrogenase